MSLAQPEQAGGRPPPGISLNLSSNNPFRNRAASPSQSYTQLSPLEPPPRPVSRNPFLDASAFPQPPVSSPDKMSFPADAKSKPVLTGNTADLFDNLTLGDKPLPKINGGRPPPIRSSTAGPPPYTAIGGRSENMPPRAPPGHRPSRSQEEAMRARKAAASVSKPRPTGELDIFADPIESSPRKADPRRVRRNSESSILEKSTKSLDPEEEKKRQERRRRERRHRDRDSKDGKSRKPDRKLDIIDKLDVTSIYGTGLFHHDGPFDACNPNRNRHGSRRAPMQAFPKDSLNNVMGGGGPINKRPNHAAFLGHNDGEAFKDYSKGGVGFNGYEPYSEQPTRPAPTKQETQVESATMILEPVHGEETLGLGTSTFLEGAPASKTAMQRRESETIFSHEGLSRKKSLAQKIRGMNNSRRDYGPTGRNLSQEGVSVSPDTPNSTSGGSKIHESNPFFNEFPKGEDSKKEGITIVEPEKIGRARAPSSPGRGFGGRLERRLTSEFASGGDVQPTPAKTIGGGFLSRVKSLKGGPRKPRTDLPMPPSIV